MRQDQFQKKECLKTTCALSDLTKLLRRCFAGDPGAVGTFEGEAGVYKLSKVSTTISKESQDFPNQVQIPLRGRVDSSMATSQEFSPSSESSLVFRLL